MKQKWVKELIRSVAINPQFMLWGNIYDIYPLQIDQGLKPLKLNHYLAEVLAHEEYTLVLYFEPLYGLSILHGSEEDAKLVSGENISKDKPTNMTLLKFIDTLEIIDRNKEISTATIFNFSSRSEQSFNHEITNEFYYKAFRLLYNSTPKKTINSNFVKYNSLIYLFDKENDIPAWYTTNNPKIKSIPIPKPDLYSREVIIQQLSRRISGYSELEDTKRLFNETLFIEQTNGLYVSEILAIISLAVKEKVAFENIGQAINMYKLGIMENEWEKVSKEKLINSENILAKRVMGQISAIGKASDILKRAYFNLSGSQYSKNSNRPKGVMFFAGPTGVGKTELAKAITELVFGSENNYIRFDMSEFSQENANQRLVGAPPGYVGYETGGELTNAVKENPFTVILFDEIEKAHPKIMDIFLQILDDGRLTSGRGETVYLSETIIIFTSNLGVYGITDDNQRVVNASIDMDYQTIQQAILSSITDYFKFKLQRPEILNRIGENVVVFDYIREDIGKNIFLKMLDSVLSNLKENHKIHLEFDNDVKSTLESVCLKDLSMGGRGIGNHLENIFINPLSRALFELNVQANETIVIKEIIQEEMKWTIKAIKKSI
jgi:ATP-dependent Clp protease ATP-binding subunit ClpA